MKFLLGDARTRKALQEETPNVIIISAFIWGVGNNHQKSLPGVLSTLLHGIFSQNAALGQRTMESDKVRFEAKREFQDWSLEELKDILKSLPNHSPVPVCAFIDGLDEIDQSLPATAMSLLSVLKGIGSHPHFKICASSRPERIFEAEFARCPHLRVQDLTAHDISTYVHASLGHLDCDFNIPTGTSFDKIVEKIVDRAQGVFLWVHLVVEYIRRDMKSFPTWYTLVERVDSPPPQLELMYEALWQRQNGPHGLSSSRADAAYFLNKFVTFQTLSSLDLALVSHPETQKILLNGGKPIPSALPVQKWARLSDTVVVRCAGLITFHNPPSSRHSEHNEEEPRQTTRDLIHHIDSKFNFIHRSARDFLLETLMGRDILRYDNLSAWEHHLQQTMGMLCVGVLTRTLTPLNPHAFEFAIRFLGSADEVVEEPLCSAFFELLRGTDMKRPGWKPTLELMRGKECSHWITDASFTLMIEGYCLQIMKYMESQPIEYQLEMTKQFVSAFTRDSIWERLGLRAYRQDAAHCEKAVLAMNSLLSRLHDVHLGRCVGSITNEPLAWYFFWFAEKSSGIFSRELDLLIDTLLAKCEDSGVYTSSQILTVPNLSQNPLRIPGKSAGFDHREFRYERRVYPLVETTMSSFFLDNESRVKKAYRKMTGLECPQNDDAPYSEKLIIMLELVFDDEEERIYDMFSKEVVGPKFAAEVIKLNEVPPKEVWEEKSRFDSLLQIYDLYDERRLDKHETLDFLITKGYIRPEFKGHPDPLKVMVRDQYQRSQRIKTASLGLFRHDLTIFRGRLKKESTREESSEISVLYPLFAEEYYCHTYLVRIQ